ncbi:DUF2975 domain-containing protein [Erythrobacter sp. SD-21]|uniref:DUF2975 domain-containing protein n=1 Tax=Erythrobacter sp. SD-21 TaxID=161528 RepID=UPI000153FB4E|nr:DUF2975 domain-containing protein [Erythrobacter sp. SD-21]EDL49152.1 hypothetical protein ED21_20769 [Erythrobacter sp. SD-21]
MPSRPNDPLLLAGRLIVIVMQAILGFAAVVLAIGMPLVVFLRDRITAEARIEYANPDFVFPLGAVLGIMAFAVLFLAGAFWFLRLLRKIIDTVGEGDPFVPENAERLTLMGWLALAAQLLAIPAAGAALYVAKIFEDQEGMTIDAGLDLSGIVLVVVLFILARVFRHGATMRADLEGTV